MEEKTPEQEPNSVHGSPRGRFETLKSVFSTLSILIIAPLVAILLTAYVFQSFEVDGPSMEETLQDGDRLIVLKTGKTWASVTGETFLPQRGDIVIFNETSNNELAAHRQLIKRVLAVPGERVVVRGGSITVYNDEFPGGFNPDKGSEWEENVKTSTTGSADFTVEPNKVFVVGDNRANSLDSRAFGPVSTDNILGTLALRIYPFDKFESF